MAQRPCPWSQAPGHRAHDIRATAQSHLAARQPTRRALEASNGPCGYTMRSGIIRGMGDASESDEIDVTEDEFDRMFAEADPAAVAVPGEFANVGEFVRCVNASSVHHLFEQKISQPGILVTAGSSSRVYGDVESPDTASDTVDA